MLLTVLSVLYLVLAAYLPAAAVPAFPAPLAPQTGDINVMIIIAVILIAAFMIFVLLKNGRRRK